MSANLDRLISKIDPSKTIDLDERRANEAIAGFNWNKVTVDSFDEHKKCLADFMRELYSHEFLTGNIDFDTDFGYGLALQRLEREFTGNTLQTVYEIMSTGSEGGVYKILKSLGRLVAEEFSRNVIGAHVSEFWSGLSTNEKIAVSDEYVEKFIDILPQSVITDRIRLKANFPKVLENHPWMIKRLRSV